MTRFQLTLIAIAALMLCASSAQAQEIRTSPGGAIRDGQTVEVYVDERGKIYKELRYHGIIPGIRDDFRYKRKKRRKRPVVSWVGFQSKQFYSRVFIKVDPVSRFIMRTPTPSKIIVEIDGARVPSRQTRRPILTGAYDSAVEKIRARGKRGGAQIEITLRKPAGYLYKRQGNYIFIDIER